MSKLAVCLQINSMTPDLIDFMEKKLFKLFFLLFILAKVANKNFF